MDNLKQKIDKLKKELKSLEIELAVEIDGAKRDALQGKIDYLQDAIRFLES